MVINISAIPKQKAIEQYQNNEKRSSLKKRNDAPLRTHKTKEKGKGDKIDVYA